MPSRAVWVAATYADSEENGGGRQWMYRSGNSVTVKSLDKDGAALKEGVVGISVFSEDGKMMEIAFSDLSSGQASVTLNMEGAQMVTAFFTDGNNRPVTGKIYAPIED